MTTEEKRMDDVDIEMKVREIMSSQKSELAEKRVKLWTAFAAARDTAAAEKTRIHSRIIDAEELPDWSGIDDLDYHDALRIVRYRADELMRIAGQDALFILDRRGLWIPLSASSAPALARCASLIAEARKATAAELRRELAADDDDLVMDTAVYLETEMTMTARHARAVSASLYNVAIESDTKVVPEISPSDFDRIDLNGHLLPVSKGGAIDIRTGTDISRSELGEARLQSRGWQLPDGSAPDKASPGSVAMAAAIENRFTPPLLRRVARHLLSLSKNIDVVVAPRSWGKGTLITALDRAFPGMIGRAEAGQALSRQGVRWSVIPSLLATHRLVYIDEAGQADLDAIPTGVVNTWIDDEIQVEKKYENVRSARRAGTAIFIGHDWPAVNASAQGIAGRVNWAFRAPDDAPPMTTAERELLLSPDGIATLRAWILREAAALSQQPDLDAATMTPESREAVALFFSARSDPYAQALRDEYEIGGKNDSVPSSEIISLLMSVDEAEKPPHGKIVGKKMRLAFHSPQVKAGRRRVPGMKNPQRVWLGIRKKTCAA